MGLGGKIAAAKKIWGAAKTFAASAAKIKAVQIGAAIAAPTVAVATIGGVAMHNMNKQTDQYIQAASSWFILQDEEFKGTTLDVYNVDVDSGLGCTKKQQEGVYSDSLVASGVGIYDGVFPDGLKKLSEVLAEPDVKASIEADHDTFESGWNYSRVVEDRGKECKAYMGLQVMAGGGTRKIGDASQYPPLYAFKNNVHEMPTDESLTINIQDYNEFFDDKGFFRVAKRYGVAVKPGYAQLMGYNRDFTPGDYIDVYFDNGKVIQCILVDVKRQKDGAAKNGETTNCVVHDDGSMIEFVVDKDSWYGSSKVPNNELPEIHEHITGMALVGSWWEDKDGTGASCVKYKSDDPYNPKASATGNADSKVMNVNRLYVGDSWMTQGGFKKEFGTDKSFIEGYAGKSAQWILDNASGDAKGVFDKQNIGVIFLAEGLNNADKPSSASTEKLIEKLHETYKNADILVAKCPHIGKESANSTINEYNKNLEAYCSGKSYLTFVDTVSGLDDENGNLKSSYQTSDGIHLNNDGEAVWFKSVHQAMNTNIILTSNTAIKGVSAIETKQKTVGDKTADGKTIISSDVAIKSDHGVFMSTPPSDAKTIQSLLDQEKSQGKVSESTAGVADRGKTKSMMGWQTLGTSASGGNITHEMHSNWEQLIGGGGAEQWTFLNAVHADNHNHSECEPLKMKRGDIKMVLDLLRTDM